MSQIIEADASQPVLIFQMWQVSRSLVELKTTIYGSNSPDGPWLEVWQPWHKEAPSVHWLQTPLFETELEQAYPYYKLELMCNYSHGIAGCKFSGVYFKVTDETGLGIEADASLETDRHGEARLNPAANGLNLEAVSATAVSDQEIEISWPEHDRLDATYQIERSFDGRGDWQTIDQVSADQWSYTDFGLLSEIEYFYRIQVSFDGGGRSRSATVSATTFSVDPVEAPAVVEEVIIAEPTAALETESALIPEPTAENEEEEPSDELIPEPTAEITVEPDNNAPQNQYGLLLIGFGIGALLVGGLWGITRRKADSEK